MSHSPTNGNPFSLVWSISLRREAYRHAEMNLWPSFSKGRTSTVGSIQGEKTEAEEKKGVILSSWTLTKKRGRRICSCFLTILSVFLLEASHWVTLGGMVNSTVAAQQPTREVWDVFGYFGINQRPKKRKHALKSVGDSKLPKFVDVRMNSVFVCILVTSPGCIRCL